MVSPLVARAERCLGPGPGLADLGLRQEVLDHVGAAAVLLLLPPARRSSWTRLGGERGGGGVTSLQGALFFWPLANCLFGWILVRRTCWFLALTLDLF